MILQKWEPVLHLEYIYSRIQALFLFNSPWAFAREHFCHNVFGKFLRGTLLVANTKSSFDRRRQRKNYITLTFVQSTDKGRKPVFKVTFKAGKGQIGNCTMKRVLREGGSLRKCNFLFPPSGFLKVAPVFVMCKFVRFAKNKPIRRKINIRNCIFMGKL